MYNKSINESYNNYTKSSAISNIGLICEYKKEYDNALEYYDRALKIDKDNILTRSKIYNNKNKDRRVYWESIKRTYTIHLQQ